MNTTTIPQAMQAIRQTVAGTVTDLIGAQNQVRSLMERPALPTPQAALIGDTLPAMLATVTSEMAATVEAFAELAGFVHGWTTAPVPTQQPVPTMTDAANGVMAAAMRLADAFDVARHVATVEAFSDPLPEPLVAETLAGGITSPSVIDASDLSPTPEPQPEPEPTPEPGGTPDEGSDELDHAAHTPVNRVGHLGNGYVEAGQELATVLAEPEPADAGKRGGKRRGKKN